MPIQANCPVCQTSYNLPDALAGKKVRCKKCEKPFLAGGTESKAKPVTAVAMKQPVNGASAPPKQSANGAGAPAKLAANGAASPAVVVPADDDEPIVAKVIEEKALKDKLQSEARPLQVVPVRGRGREDDEAPRHGPEDNEFVKPKSANTLTWILLGGAAALILLVIVVCGVGVFLFYRAGKKAGETVVAEQQAAVDQMQIQAQGGNNAAVPVTVDDALKNLKSQDPAERQNAGNWLAQHQDDPGRKADVVRALNAELNDGNQNVRVAAVNGLRKWGPDRASVPGLIRVLQDESVGADTHKECMEMLAELKDERGAPAIASRLRNFFEHDQAIAALQQMGPVAEKAVVKYFFDREAAPHARRVLSSYGTKDEVILDQALIDLRAGDAGRRVEAANWVAKQKPNTPRRKEVAAALEELMEDQDGNVNAAGIKAMMIWATKENVPAIAKLLRDENNPFPGGTHEQAMQLLGKLKDERGAAPVAKYLVNFHYRARGIPQRALRAMGPVAEKEVIKYVFHSDAGVQKDAQSILKDYGTKDDVIVEQALVEMKDVDAASRQAAGNVLAKIPASEKQQELVAQALVKMMADSTGEVKLAALKGLVNWATKDSVPTLVQILANDDIFVKDQRFLAMDALARLKDERGVAPVAVRLRNIFDRDHASKCLKEMGPIAEPVVLTGLVNPDANFRIECCKILGVIGTKASITKMNMLLKSGKEKDRRVAQAMIDAAQQINGRQ